MTGVLKLSMPKSLPARLVTAEIGLINVHLEGKERSAVKRQNQTELVLISMLIIPLEVFPSPQSDLCQGKDH